MVVPNRHFADLAETSAEERAELMRLVRHAEMALTEAYRPTASTSGSTSAAPQAPACSSTCTFISSPGGTATPTSWRAIGETRVLPEDLAHSAARLRPIFERITKSDTLATRTETRRAAEPNCFSVIFVPPWQCT